MPTYTKAKLSGSSDGKAIKVTGTNTSGAVTIHTAVSGTINIDEIYLYAQNNDADGETRTLTIEFGGSSDPDNLIILPVPARSGILPICEGLILQNGQVIKAFADEANDIQIYGYVHTRTE